MARFSPNGKLVVSAGTDCTARVWDVQSGKELKILQGHESQVFTFTFTFSFFLLYLFCCLRFTEINPDRLKQLLFLLMESSLCLALMIKQLACGMLKQEKN